MNRFAKVMAIIATSVGITSMLLAIIGGSVLIAIEGLLGVITLGGSTGASTHTPVAGIFAIYACGIVLGIAAFRWPAPAGIAMLPLGLLAFLLGGPIAKVYGIVIACAGALIVFAELRSRQDCRSKAAL